MLNICLVYTSTPLVSQHFQLEALLVKQVAGNKWNLTFKILQVVKKTCRRPQKVFYPAIFDKTFPLANSKIIFQPFYKARHLSWLIQAINYGNVAKEFAAFHYTSGFYIRLFKVAKMLFNNGKQCENGTKDRLIRDNLELKKKHD